MSTATAIKNNIEAIAIGGFDGMHIGHQHLFSALGKNGGIVVIETGYANLTPKREREKFTSYPLFYYQLEDIRHLDGENFIKMLESKFPKLKKIVVGYDFHFGKNRQSSHKNLQEFFSGEVVVIDEVLMKDDSIHSHKIRAKIQLGDIKGANAFLGHNYTIHGDVITGQGLGKKELVATINLHVEGYLLPQEGVYATLTRIDDEEHFYPSVSFLGHRVTTDGNFAIETHIIDENVTCKNKASISFVDFIRKNKKFDSLENLKETIGSDIKNAIKVINRVSL